MIWIKLAFLPITLIAPLWEVHDDRNGDVHPNYDWVWRSILCLISGIITGLWTTYLETRSIDWTVLAQVARYTVCSGGVFISIFPYWINWVHLKNKVTAYKEGRTYLRLSSREIFDHVVNHLSDSAVPDKWKFWRKIGWIGRGIVYLGILISSIILWFI